MKQTFVEKPEIKLVGISIRTNNQEANIGPCVQRYFHNALFEKILNRKNPGTTFCAYTDYESDYTGAYTYFIGEEVSSLEQLPEGFVTLTIPPQTYVKFTTQPGPMPGVVQDAWQEIWNSSDLNDKRNYQTDFELYDERAADHQNVVLDLFIGV